MSRIIFDLSSMGRSLQFAIDTSIPLWRKATAETSAEFARYLLCETELDTFCYVWHSRAHLSQVSFDPLGEDMQAHFFSHILPKSTYPAARMDPNNIILMTLEEHQLWENSKSALLGIEKWRSIFEKEKKLKSKYAYVPTN
jgi:hypothetical protein